MGMCGRGDYTFLRAFVATSGRGGWANGKPSAPVRLLLEIDLVVTVVDVDRVKFAEDVFAKKAVEVGAENVAEAVEIHDGDAPREPCMAIELEIDGQSHALADKAGLLAGALRETKTVAYVPVDLRADDRARGAGVEQKCHGLTVDLAFDEDHRLNRAKREMDNVGMRDIPKG